MNFEGADTNPEYQRPADVADAEAGDYLEDAVTCDSDAEDDLPDRAPGEISSSITVEEMDAAAIEENVSRWLDERCEELVRRGTTGGSLAKLEQDEVCLELRIRMHRAARKGDMDGVDECVRTFSLLRTAEDTPVVDQVKFGSLLYAEAVALGSGLAMMSFIGVLPGKKSGSPKLRCSNRGTWR